MGRFILTCESTVDLTHSYISERNIPVLYYSYCVDGKSYPDDMQQDPDGLSRFYRFIEEGKIPTTSQLNFYEYYHFFEDHLSEGDILHIAFGSGMTQAVNNARMAAEELMENHPGRKITVIDSLSSTSGYGLLVDQAADLRDEGKSMEEITDWVMENRLKVQQHFFTHQLDYFRRSGRMSGPAATVATVLNICPIMCLDDAGKIIAYDKVRGRKKAIETTVQTMLQHAQNGKDYDGKCYISHSNCIDGALLTKETIEAQFPNLKGKVRIWNIGPIIASHCGPGTVFVAFMGDDRKPVN